MQFNRKLTLYPFYTAKKIPRDSTHSIRILFEIVFRWRCIRVRQNGVFLSSIATFADLQYNPSNFTPQVKQGRNQSQILIGNRFHRNTTHRQLHLQAGRTGETLKG